MEQEGHPPGGSFDEAELEVGKLLWNLIRDDIAKSQERLHPAVAEGVIALDAEEIEEQRAAGAGVNANRQIEIVGRLINGKQIGIIESPPAFDAAKKNSHGAVVLGPFEFPDGFVNRLQRRDDPPPHPAVGLRASLGEES